MKNIFGIKFGKEEVKDISIKYGVFAGRLIGLCYTIDINNRVSIVPFYISTGTATPDKKAKGEYFPILGISIPKDGEQFADNTYCNFLNSICGGMSSIDGWIYKGCCSDSKNFKTDPRTYFGKRELKRLVDGLEHFNLTRDSSVAYNVGIKEVLGLMKNYFEYRAEAFIPNIILKEAGLIKEDLVR